MSFICCEKKTNLLIFLGFLFTSTEVLIGAACMLCIAKTMSSATTVSGSRTFLEFKLLWLLGSISWSFRSVDEIIFCVVLRKTGTFLVANRKRFVFGFAVVVDTTFDNDLVVVLFNLSTKIH